MNGQPFSTDERESGPALVRGFNALGLRLYGHLRGEENCFFSPLSIATALSMLLPGAKGVTLREIATLLGLDEQLETAPQRIASLMAVLIRRRFTDWEYDEATGENREVARDAFRLHLANGLFLKKGYALKSAYRDILQADFKAGLYPTDFENPQGAADQINGWVTEQTKGMIPNLIHPSLIEPLTRMVLLNAVYFFAEWETKFHERATRPEPFYLLPGANVDSVQVPMMHAELSLPYAADTKLGIEAVDIPYKAMSMLVLLPKPGMLESLEQGLSGSALERIDRQLTTREVDLGLPKFAIESGYQLSNCLRSLGVEAAFDQAAADFGGITDDPLGLVISEVIHRARIRVDEHGTEAAAATAMVAVGATALVMPPKPIPFIVNRPFLFFIRDDVTKTILFAGRVTNPAA
jgi:serpin B